MNCSWLVSSFQSQSATETNGLFQEDLEAIPTPTRSRELTSKYCFSLLAYLSDTYAMLTTTCRADYICCVGKYKGAYHMPSKLISSRCPILKGE